MNVFEETGETFVKLIMLAVGLIVPGSIFVYSVLGSASLRGAGHETAGNVVGSSGEVYGGATTSFGLEILNIVSAAPLFVLLLCFFYVVGKRNSII